MNSYSDILTAAGVVITSGALLFAGWSDLRRYIIPNRAPAAIALAYLLAIPGVSWPMWLGGLATALATLGVGSFLFARQWVGGGDVKLASAIVLWAGPTLLADFVMMVSVSAAALAGIMIALPRSGAAAAGQLHSGTLAARLNQPMPFGVPLAVGGLWIVVSPLLTSLN
jgi:prepilin peptidase CpaA